MGQDAVFVSEGRLNHLDAWPSGARHHVETDHHREDKALVRALADLDVDRVTESWNERPGDPCDNTSRADKGVGALGDVTIDQQVVAFRHLDDEPIRCLVLAPMPYGGEYLSSARDVEDVFDIQHGAANLVELLAVGSAHHQRFTEPEELAVYVEYGIPVHVLDNVIVANRDQRLFRPVS